jgi:hypothetical protein
MFVVWRVQDLPGCKKKLLPVRILTNAACKTTAAQQSKKANFTGRNRIKFSLNKMNLLPFRQALINQERYKDEMDRASSEGVPGICRVRWNDTVNTSL